MGKVSFGIFTGKRGKIKVLSQPDHVPGKGGELDGHAAGIYFGVAALDGDYLVRVFFSVDGFHIVMVQDNVLHGLQATEGAQVAVQGDVLLLVPVDGKDGKAAVIAEGCRGIHERNLFIVLAIIDRRGDDRTQG